MARSRRFIQLSSRIAFLENNILPHERIDGNYSKKESDLIRSYLLLVHAEIEAYFEDVVKDKVRKSLAKWIANRTKSGCLKSVLAFAGNDLNYDNVPKSQTNDIAFRMNRAVSHYLSIVDKNNGVKQKDILKMIIPAGLELHELDDTWLSIMDNFGATRGNIAHNSLRVQNQIDRNTERDRINNQILPEIERLDELLKKD